MHSLSIWKHWWQYLWQKAWNPGSPRDCGLAAGFTGTGLRSGSDSPLPLSVVIIQKTLHCPGTNHGMSKPPFSPHPCPSPVVPTPGPWDWCPVSTTAHCICGQYMSGVLRHSVSLHGFFISSSCTSVTVPCLSKLPPPSSAPLAREVSLVTWAGVLRSLATLKVREKKATLKSLYYTRRVQPFNPIQRENPGPESSHSVGMKSWKLWRNPWNPSSGLEVMDCRNLTKPDVGSPGLVSPRVLYSHVVALKH